MINFFIKMILFINLFLILIQLYIDQITWINNQLIELLKFS